MLEHYWGPFEPFRKVQWTMVQRADGLAWRTIDGETFVVNLRQKMMYGLNTTGGLFWQAIVGGDSLDAVARRVALGNGRQWPAEVVQAAVAAFLRELADLELLTLDEAESPGSGETAPCLDGFEAPAVIWHEEMVAYAQATSCLVDPLNCPAGPVI